MESITANKTTPDKTQLFYEALAAYVTAKKVTDEWIAMPLRTHSLVSKKHVKLRTGCFILAKYDLIKKELTNV